MNHSIGSNNINIFQVFFRAGVLGELEEIRDDRLGKLTSWLQAWIRGFVSRKYYKKQQEQRVALIVIQRNMKKYLQMRTWPWYRLWSKVKPLLNVSRIDDMMTELEEKANKALAEYEKEVVLRKELESKNGVLLSETTDLRNALDSASGGASEFREKQAKLAAQKAELDGQLNVSVEKMFEILIFYSLIEQIPD